MEKEVIESKPYFKYAQDIVSGKIIAGNYIILMCKRFLNDLNDDRFDFRTNEVDRAIRFIGTLKHFKGKSSGQNFILQPW